MKVFRFSLLLFFFQIPCRGFFISLFINWWKWTQKVENIFFLWKFSTDWINGAFAVVCGNRKRIMIKYFLEGNSNIWHLGKSGAIKDWIIKMDYTLYSWYLKIELHRVSFKFTLKSIWTQIHKIGQAKFFMDVSCWKFWNSTINLLIVKKKGQRTFLKSSLFCKLPIWCFGGWVWLFEREVSCSDLIWWVSLSNNVLSRWIQSKILVLGNCQ